MPNHTDATDHIAGHTIIRFSDVDPACLQVEAVIEEQDTDLLLGKSPVIMYTVESFPELIKRIGDQARNTPGSVIVKHSTPKRFIAIVYDVEHTPICLQAWVEQALARILQLCEQYRIKSLAMPLLGTSYGAFHPGELMRILQNMLNQCRSRYPKKIYIYRIDG